MSQQWRFSTRMRCRERRPHHQPLVSKPAPPVKVEHAVAGAHALELAHVCALLPDRQRLQVERGLRMSRAVGAWLPVKRMEPRTPCLHLLAPDLAATQQTGCLTSSCSLELTKSCVGGGRRLTYNRLWIFALLLGSNEWS